MGGREGGGGSLSGFLKETFEKERVSNSQGIYIKRESVCVKNKICGKTKTLLGINYKQ